MADCPCCGGWGTVSDPDDITDEELDALEMPEGPVPPLHMLFPEVSVRRGGIKYGKNHG